MMAEDALKIVNDNARKVIRIDSYSELFLFYKYIEQVSKSYSYMTVEQATEKFSIFKCVAFFLLLFGLTGCTNPFWWFTEERVFYYRNWRVTVADQATVMNSCKSFMGAGCALPAFAVAFSVNNAYIMSHECGHIDDFTDKLMRILDDGLEMYSPEAMTRAQDIVTTEVSKDLLLFFSGFNDMATILTFPVPATDCGSEAGKRGYVTRESTLQQHKRFDDYLHCRGEFKNLYHCISFDVNQPIKQNN